MDGALAILFAKLREINANLERLEASMSAGDGVASHATHPSHPLFAVFTTNTNACLSKGGIKESTPRAMQPAKSAGQPAP